MPFLPQHVQDQLVDERGNFELYRQILPHELANLTFCGYNSSFFSPLSAEVAALWIGTHLAGKLALPPIAQRRKHVTKRLRWMEERTEGKHARGTNIIPFSIHNIDEMLDDLGVRAGGLRRLTEWLIPLNPSAYVKIFRNLLDRNARQPANAPDQARPALDKAPDSYSLSGRHHTRRG